MNEAPINPPIQPRKGRFEDPYSIGHYEKGEVGRIQCDIPKSEYRKFYCVLPSRKDAVFQTTFSIITCKLITLLESKGINSQIHEDEYKSLIADLVLTDGRKPTVATTAATKPIRPRRTSVGSV